MRLVEEHDLGPRLPERQPSAPLLLEEAGEARGRLARQERQEHRLAVLVRGAVEGDDAAEILDELQGRRRHRADPREAAFAIEEAGRLLALHADDGGEHEAGPRSEKRRVGKKSRKRCKTQW